MFRSPCSFYWQWITTTAFFFFLRNKYSLTLSRSTCAMMMPQGTRQPGKTDLLGLYNGHWPDWEGKAARLKRKEKVYKWINLLIRNIKTHVSLSQLYTSRREAVPVFYNWLRCLSLKIPFWWFNIVPHQPARILGSRSCPWMWSWGPLSVLGELPNLECSPFCTPILFQGWAQTSALKLFLKIPTLIRFLLSELPLHLSIAQI